MQFEPAALDRILEAWHRPVTAMMEQTRSHPGYSPHYLGDHKRSWVIDPYLKRLVIVLFKGDLGVEGITGA